MLISLTGDRPSGKLHLGHYVGSLQNRLKLQNEYRSYILVADTQAMTDLYLKRDLVKASVIEVMKDYLAVGLSPSVFCLQSSILELYELTNIFMNYVSLNRVLQNPTLKEEMKQKANVNLGFLLYPIAQAADILGFNADVVPVGEDQLPMIEQTNDIASKINEVCQKELLKPVKALLSETPRLIGIDGKFKATKTLNNCIFLADTQEEIAQKVKKMYTDSNHLKISDPGQVEGNVVFEYLDAFARDKEKVTDMKEHYRKGGLGDSVIKAYLLEELLALMMPIYERRNKLDSKEVYERLIVDTETARAVVQARVNQIKDIIF